MKRFKEYGCTVDKICNTPESKIKELIFESNFNNTKAKNIKKIA
jgi:endonuclease III